MSNIGQEGLGLIGVFGLPGCQAVPDTSLDVLPEVTVTVAAILARKCLVSVLAQPEPIWCWSEVWPTLLELGASCCGRL